MDRSKSKEYESVFSRFDENKDGKITVAELRLCMETIGGEISEAEADVEADAEAMVRQMDSDGDGLLGMEDFIRLMEGTEEKEKVEDLKEAFKKYKEGEECGCITPRSLKRVLSRLGDKKSFEECEAMISPFDLNKDGVLNFEEFRNMMMA